MFSDPQVVTINTVATNLARVSTPNGAGKFALADLSEVMTITVSDGKRRRRTLRLDNNKTVADPYATDRNLPVGMSVSLVVDFPLVGYTTAEAKYQVIAVADWLKASTNTDRLLGGEA